jgi:DNA-binding response OmpR family regulator
MTMGAALRILAVDDEPSITHSMRFIFASPRYEVTGAQSGDDALAKLDANSDAYDVIIIDQKMPHLTGVELVEEIRKRGFAGKIMVLSAHLSREIREAYEQMDVPVLLDKPFNIHELRSVLNNLAA